MTNILIVEDNEMNRDMISRRLSKKGFAVSMAVDGEEGIDKAHAEKPDLILMDLSLPKIDGWEATRRLKAAADTRKIPVIALTAHAMSGCPRCGPSIPPSRPSWRRVRGCRGRPRRS
jgi:two-component system, cell cycle response regulator DivK